jgi:hypothetical protein
MSRIHGKSGCSALNLMMLTTLFLIIVPTGYAQQGLPFTKLDLSNTDEFQSPPANWIIAGDVFMDLFEYRDVQPSPGSGILLNTSSGDNPQDIFTEWEHGDLDLELEFMMASESNSGIYFQGRYELQMLDSWGVDNPKFYDMGGVYQWWEDGAGKGGIAPRANASRAPGLWQQLEVKFRAPRFDENGNKIEHARFEEVKLNGVMIHRNVTLVHPTGGAVSNEETEFAPLRIQGDHGPVAFRNIRYKSYRNSPVQFLDLAYTYHAGEFESAEDVTGSRPAGSGTSNNINLDMLLETSEIGVVYSGYLNIEHSGEYFFDTRTDGGHRLMIGGSVLSAAGDGNRRLHPNQVIVNLEQGSHRLELVYFRGARGGLPAAGLFVEGPGLKMHPLHEASSLPLGTQNLPLLVEPADKPVVMHGFMDMGGNNVHTHTAAVGYPQGVNFAFDQNSGALMKIWKGDFINAATMWVGRGGRNLSLNEDTAITINAWPSIAKIDGARDVWPAAHSVDAEYRLYHYRILEDNTVAFHYRLHDTAIHDILKSDNEGKLLTRALTFTNTNPGTDITLMIRVAAADQIRILPNQLYEIDGKQYYVQIQGAAAGSARIRTVGNSRELLIPVQIGDETSIEYSYIW